MNVHNRDITENPADRIWNTLSRRVTEIDAEVSYCELDMCRMGSLYPYRTFPEARMLEVADRLEKAAAAARDMVSRAAALRQDIAS
jgi:hypothetical protein